MAMPNAKHEWKFDEAGGKVAQDAVGGAQFAIDNETWFADGRGLRLHPDNGIRHVESNLPDLAAPWTLSLSLMRQADTGSSCLLGSEHFALKLEQFEGQHNLGLTAYGVGDFHFDYVTTLHAWVHLVWVGETDTTRLYVNGQLQQSLPIGIDLPLRWLGNSGGWTDFAAAQIDQMCVFDVALDAAQVAELTQLRSLAQPALALSLDGRSVGRSGASTNWGTMAHGKAKSCQLLLANNGSGPLVYSLKGQDDTGQFQLATTDNGTLAAGASIGIPVGFTSQQEGRIGFAVTIHSNDPALPDLTHTIYANGKGPRT